MMSRIQISQILQSGAGAAVALLILGACSEAPSPSLSTGGSSSTGGSFSMTRSSDASGSNGDPGGAPASTGPAGRIAAPLSGPTPMVRDGCEKATYNGHIYALCRDKEVGFPAARKDCVAMSMRLVRIDDAAENDWIYRTFYSGAIKNGMMWTGATDNVVEGEWRWLIGGDMFWKGDAKGMAVGGLYETWGSAHGMTMPHNQPNNSHSAEGEDCMVIRGPAEGEGGHWTDIGCDEENNPPAPHRQSRYTCEQY